MSTPVKLGSTILVEAIGTQGQSTPSVTAIANGQFLVGWVDLLAGSPFNNYGIRGQYFNANGLESGTAFDIVNSGGSFFVQGDLDPDVIGLAGGGFSATADGYSEAGGPQLFHDIAEEIFSGTTSTAGGFLVFSQFSNASQPRQAQLGNGNIVVTWQQLNASQSFDAIYADILTSSGTVITAGIQVSMGTDDQIDASVAAMANGGFVVVWEDDATAQSTVWFQRYDANGNAVGSNTLVPAHITGAQSAPVVASLANGQFVVVYEDTSGAYSGDTSGKAIVARVFNADGTAAGDFLVDTTSNGDQSAPAVLALADGRFFVAWVDASGAGGAGTDIRGQLFKAGAGGAFVKDGSEILIDTPGGNQATPSLSTTPDGRILVSWQTTNAAGGEGIDVQILDPREHGMTFDATVAGEQFFGTAYNDALYADADTVFTGGGGFDTVIETTPGVTINVGAGTTLYQVQEVILNGGTNVVNGTYSSDFIYLYGGGANSTNTMTLGSGGGYEISTGGTNHMFGGISSTATDVFIGGIGASDMHGGTGNNVYYSGASDTVSGAGTYNTNVLLAPGVTLTNGGNISDVQQVILNGGTNSVDMTGSADFDIIFGGAGTNTMTLGAGGGYEFATGGTNHMFGSASGSGTDVFIGGTGTSDMHGGGGSNVYYVGVNDSVVGGGTYNTLTALAPGLQLTQANASDVQSYLLNGGDNVVDASASSKPVIMTEQSYYYGTASDTFTGGSGNDYLLAYGHGQNILNGGPGDDVLIGWGQNHFIFQPGSGHDVVESYDFTGTDWFAGGFTSGTHNFDLTAFAAVGIHSISDLTITDTQDSNGNPQLLVQMGSDSFSLFKETPTMHLTAADFVFA